MNFTNVEYIAKLFVRPRQGGAPVLRGPIVVHRELSANQVRALNEEPTE